MKNIGLNAKNCSDENGSGKFHCSCYGGFEGERCEIDLCDGVFCQNGSCEAGNCICNNGYIKIENNCEETCALSPCEVSFSI